MFNWTHINRKRVKHIRRAQATLMRQFRLIRNALNESMQGYSDPSALQGVVDNFQLNERILTEAWKQIYRDTGMAFAEMNYMDLKGKAGEYEKKDFNDDIRRSVWFEKLMDYVDNECGEFIQSTTRAMFAGIRNNAQKAIKLAAQEGWGADRTAREIMRLQGEMDKYRAMRIARTEVMRASNEGAMEGVSDLPFAVNKIWISTTDGRTRTFADGDFDHSIMNGVKVDQNESFDVGGEMLDYPGDPAGSEGNVINCRCAVAFEPKESIL